MGNKTPLYQAHLLAHGKMVDFAGWDMPLHYGSQLEEHQEVRKDAGMFDVSHMTVIDIFGPDAYPFLKKILANDIGKLTVTGKAIYSCMLNDQGGVIDDLICYFFTDQDYRLIVNAATRVKDLAWLEKQAQNFQVSVNALKETAMIAIQGPLARAKTHELFNLEMQQRLANLKPFHSIKTNDWHIARTGYTGEDGYEIILPAQEAENFWKKLRAQQIKPCGLGARDTLRLEAGLNLYGSDMDETTSPLISNLAWTVAFDPPERDFIGKKALERERQRGVSKKLVGLLLEGRGVLRSHQKVEVEGRRSGEITSGTFSPYIGKAIALARIPNVDAKFCRVEIRDKWYDARIIKPPFVRHGEILVS